MIRTCGLAVLILIIGGAGSWGGDGPETARLTRTFLDGVKAYEAGAFEEAAAAFDRVAAAGIDNAKLFYNLGNAHLKAGDLGRAVLWYERALRLAPGAPDLRFNHAYALSLVKDEREGKGAAIYQVLFFWRYRLGRRTVQWIAIGLNAGFFLLLSIRLLRGKRPLKGLGHVGLALCLLFAATALYNHYESRQVRYGVILPEAVSVRSGLSESATELFTLHAGTRVRVERERDGFFRIFFEAGKIGWVRADGVGII